METTPQGRFAFSKNNFIIMFVGIALIGLGYIVMSLETAEYGFGTLGLTVGPILLMLGFTVQFFAIFYKQKKS